jgi:hypothetical protein
MVVQKYHQPPYFMDRVAISTVAIPTPVSPGVYNLRLFGAEHDRALATADVNVVDDVAPPEATVIPLAAIDALIRCESNAPQIEVLMHTIGWYDDPFTLTARVVDESGQEIARSAADVEFPAERPRHDLLTTHQYNLPLESVPASEDGALTLLLIAYRWQHEAQRIVPRHFVEADGSVVPVLHLPLSISPTCVS